MYKSLTLLTQTFLGLDEEKKKKQNTTIMSDVLSTEEFNKAQTKYQSIMAEDAIVEINGKTGDVKKYHDQLVALDEAIQVLDKDKMDQANQALKNVFGKFTSLVVESWRDASSIREKQSK